MNFFDRTKVIMRHGHMSHSVNIHIKDSIADVSNKGCMVNHCEGGDGERIEVKFCR